MKVLVVDDEAPARAKLRRLLAAEPDVESVAEAADGRAAVEAIRRDRPDLVLLDVQMPGLDGFGVIEEVGAEAMPPVVFVTAFDQHAVRAFEVHAVDYLLKPFAPGRLRRTLERVRGAASGAAGVAAADLAARLERLLAGLAPAASAADAAKAGEDAPGGAETAAEPPLRRLLVAAGDERELLLPVDEIDLLRADANYVEIVAGDRTYRRRGPLTALAARLDPQAFLRINRSEVVRLDAIAELQPWFHGDYRIVLESGRELTWSRRYRARDRERFE